MVWKYCSECYIEKLVIFDISVVDLVGDVDLIKVVEGCSFGDFEIIVYGFILWVYCGIVVVNELFDFVECI